jgi:hypothetical protein
MRFRHRLGWYSIGFFMGIFFVSMIFMGKDTRCNYFPNARVLNSFRTKSFNYSDQAKADMTTLGMQEKDVNAILYKGDVDFSRSNIPADGGKKYIVQGQTIAGENVELTVINYDEKAVLKSVVKIK